MEVVLNKCYGGFGLSNQAVIELIEMDSDILKKSPLKDWGKTEFEDFGVYKISKAYEGIIIK
jgi:hypothetical protein